MNDRDTARGFFHTMVVMGSALALGCGGESRHTDGTNADAAGGGAGSGVASGGSTSDGTGGVTAASGRTSSDGTGGVTAASGGTSNGGTSNGGAGGGITVSGGTGGGAGFSVGGSGAAISFGGSPAAAGSSAAGGSGGAAVLDCPPSQWSCPTDSECITYLDPSAAYCTCDPTRPETQADCSPYQSFVCRYLVDYDASGTPHSTAYQCSCLTRQADCSTACLDFLGVNGRCSMPPATSADPILCDCAPVLLR